MALIRLDQREGVACGRRRDLEDQHPALAARSFRFHCGDANLPPACAAADLWAQSVRWFARVQAAAELLHAGHGY